MGQNQGPFPWALILIWLIMIAFGVGSLWLAFGLIDLFRFILTIPP